LPATPSGCGPRTPAGRRLTGPPEPRERLAELPQDLLLGDPGPELMFDDRLYKRGALARHALRLVLGDAAFFAMLQAWAQLNRHSTVTTDMFIEHATRFSDQSLVSLFDRWLLRTELPELNAAG
jgi:aminopeptidase N